MTTAALTPASRRRPPGPRDFFFGFGLLYRLLKDYLGVVQDNHRRHGDVVYMRFGHLQDYSVNHPDLIREVLVEKGKSFIRWERGIEVFAQAHGQSVLTTEGGTWQRQRRMLQPGFGPKRFEGYARQMVAAAAPALDALPVSASQPLDFEGAMTLLTMDVILRTMFSLGTVPEASAAAEAVKVISHAGMREMYLPFDPPAWMLPWRREKERSLKLLDELVRRFVRERRAAPGEQQDLLGMLLSVRDDEGDRQGLSDEEVRDQCMTIFLAGHETTATALTWWGWAMAAHPQIAERAAREVDEVLGGREPTYADVGQLAYLGQTLKETMRLRPPAAALLSRQAIEDVTIGGWRVPRGAMVRITPYAVHHDPRWFPEPERFDPDRFAPERAEQMPRGAYLPFGAGPRVCIGSMFATIEMTLIAALLLQRFRFALPPQAPAPMPRLNVTLRPAEGLRLLLRRR